ncbi:hypothetical protein Q2T40_15970 [Winogradskyella maritima]|uniref:SPW repeat-containing protein n=1 Tax=Winogradskyella maritima TaxID=1517766 RepID=A0ABV8AGG8_9FLAO|nr:hypothetical protein [Winogradskyella maritima]
MRFITKKIHSYLDYPVAISLILLPFLLGLGETNPIAFYLSVIVGVAALGLTILTDHQTGLLSLIPYRLHLIVDGAVAILFLLAPFIFSFEGLDAYFYWINGAAVLLVVSLHKAEVQKPVALA